MGFPHSSVGKESTWRPWFDSWVGKIPWRRDRLPTPVFLGSPCGSAGKESTCNAGDLGSNPWVGKIPWRRQRLPTPVFWPGGCIGLYIGCIVHDCIVHDCIVHDCIVHGLYSPWGHKDLDVTFTFTFSLSKFLPVPQLDSYILPLYLHLPNQGLLSNF